MKSTPECPLPISYLARKEVTAALWDQGVLQQPDRPPMGSTDRLHLAANETPKRPEITEVETISSHKALSVT